ncbi:MAG: FAD-binding protein [Candidatus Cloacimonadales bacterium]
MHNSDKYKQSTNNKSKILHSARRCRHYAMCKVDFLGTGVCPSGRKNHFVSFYPQGMMDITAAVLENRIPVTTGLVDVANGCTLCGICDSQCYFVTELRPFGVFQALKSYVDDYLQSNDPVEIPSDEFLNKIRAITGEKYATNDPAHLMAYSNDPFPNSFETMPRYVVVPDGTQQVSEIVKLCRREAIDYTIRGNGSSAMGFVLGRGLIIDTIRMKKLEFDIGNRAVTIGAGISAFELQKEAVARGYRVNAAEPSALYCANIMCSGLFSLFSSSYGTGTDSLIDAEFVSKAGDVFALSQRDAPNLYGFSKSEPPIQGICTQAVVKLHPIVEDESALAVPFSEMQSAIAYAKELNRRHIGLGIGVLGGEYLSTFISPTSEIAETLRQVFHKELGIEYLVLVLGNKHHLDAAREMAPLVFEQELMKALILGVSALGEDGLIQILRGMEGEAKPYEILAKPEMLPIIEAALDPSPKLLSEAVDSDLKSFYEKLYSRPELSDMLWLNTFRIVSSRMGRDGHLIVSILYLPLDNIPQVEEIHKGFQELTHNCGVRGEFGFLTPVDQGAMGIFEWDMYLDHADPEEVEKMQKAMEKLGIMVKGFAQQDPRVLWIGDVLNKGFSRKEAYLYNGASFNE